jgi:DNA-binding response OmpR family regulator
LIDVKEKTEQVIKNALPELDVFSVPIVQEGKLPVELQQERPEAVVLQAQSHKDKTVELCKNITEKFADDKVPLLVAVDRREDITQIQYVLEAGADKCFITPTTPSDFKEKIKSVLA